MTFHCPVIFPHLLKSIWCTNIIWIICRAGTIHQFIDKSWSGSPWYRIKMDLSDGSIFQSESSLLNQSCKLVCVLWNQSRKVLWYKMLFIGLADHISAIIEVMRHLPLSRMIKIGEVTIWCKTEFPIWQCQISRLRSHFLSLKTAYISSKMILLKE